MRFGGKTPLQIRSFWKAEAQNCTERLRSLASRGGGRILQSTTERHSSLQCSGGLSFGVAERCFGNPRDSSHLLGFFLGYQSWRQGRVISAGQIRGQALEVRRSGLSEEATPPEQDGLALVAARQRARSLRG